MGFVSLLYIFELSRMDTRYSMRHTVLNNSWLHNYQDSLESDSVLISDPNPTWKKRPIRAIFLEL